MEEQPKLAPFVLKPHRINNYTHLIALLKIKQKKYKDYTHPPVNTAFSNILGTYKDALDLDGVFEGFLHKKLTEKAVEFENQIHSDLLKSISNKIKEIKIENDQRLYSNKIGNLAECESLLFTKPTLLTFKDDLLFDLYLYINKKCTPITFLQQSFLKYMLKFSNENNADNFDSENNLDSLSLKRIVKEFVKLRYNSEEYKIEVYESRYLWAEIFVFLRIGRSDLALEIINENEIYFEFMNSKFKSIFTGFLNGKKSNFAHNFRNEDKFKKFLYDLTEEKAKSDGLIISTVEDFLWLKLLLEKEIKNDISEFSNNKIKFMIALLSRKYMKAIDILLKSDFSIVPKFFLLRELCLEQSFSTTEIEPTNIFDISNSVKPQMRSRVFLEDSSSTTSLMSMTEGNTSTIAPVFLNFLFNLVSKLSTKEHKVKLVEMLKNHPDYYNIVPNYVIKYELFDILGKSHESTSNIEYSLDDKVAAKVLSILKEKGDRSKIIQLHYLIDDVSMIQFLKEAVEEAILIDESLNINILEKYLKKKITKDSFDLENMYGFYKFYINPTTSNLKTSALFDQNINLKPYRFVIEKIFSKAVDVVKCENDQQMARYLFKLCGVLDLNEECSSKISRDLVSLI